MHLFSKENIWSNPAVSCIQSSHPDKNNNSVDRIISKEEEREDPRRDSSIYLRVQELQDSFEYSVFLQELQELQCFHTQSSKFPVIPCKETILHTELILLLQELQGSSRVIPCRSVQGIFQQLFPVSPSTPHGRLQL